MRKLSITMLQYDDVQSLVLNLASGMAAKSCAAGMDLRVL